MRVLYFGTYERAYPRNAHTIACLRRGGVEVVERHEPVWEHRRESWRAGARTAARVAIAQLRLRRPIAGSFDAVVIGYPGHLDVAAARRAVPDVPLVLNPLVSLFDTLVRDRGRFRSGSLAAALLRTVDERAFSSADAVVADTAAHAALFASLGARRLDVCFVGAEEDVFHPPWEPAEPPHVLFVGKLIPLHGLETIVDAARMVDDVRFRIVGSGQRLDALRARPPNVEWVPWLDYRALGGAYRAATCALGIFGTTPKAARVIPNKAFHALACGVPLVTADTPAARELLVDGESALLVPPGDAGALADAVRALLLDAELRARIARGGHAAYLTHASTDVLARCWRDVVERAAR